MAALLLRVARELSAVVACALLLALALRASASKALAARTGPARPRVTAVAPPAALSTDGDVLRAPAAAPIVAATPRAATRARPTRASASARASVAREPERWVELRPRLYERADGTLRADLRGVDSISEFARGMRARASADGGFEVVSLDQQGYLAAAGVRPGDRLVMMNGRSTRSLDELLTAYALGRLGSTVSLQFARGQGHYAISAEVLRGDRTP
jgi:PDZ domain